MSLVVGVFAAIFALRAFLNVDEDASAGLDTGSINFAQVKNKLKSQQPFYATKATTTIGRMDRFAHSFAPLCSQSNPSAAAEPPMRCGDHGRQQALHGTSSASNGPREPPDRHTVRRLHDQQGMPVVHHFSQNSILFFFHSLTIFKKATSFVSTFLPHLPSRSAQQQQQPHLQIFKNDGST